MMKPDRQRGFVVKKVYCNSGLHSNFLRMKMVNEYDWTEVTIYNLANISG